MNINIKTKLKAYTRATLPTKLSQFINDMDFISDVPDNRTYVRTKGEWVLFDKPIDIALVENSGLNLEYGLNEQGKPTYYLGVRKEEITELELPAVLEPDTVYYVEDLTPTLYIDGGTAFSNGNNDFVVENEYTQVIDGGNVNTHNYDLVLLPINSKGVYDGQ